MKHIETYESEIHWRPVWWVMMMGILYIINFYVFIIFIILFTSWATALDELKVQQIFASISSHGGMEIPLIQAVHLQ